MSSVGPRLFGVKEFVQELAKELDRAKFRRRYSSKELLKRDVVQVLEQFLDDVLVEKSGLSYQLWQGLAEPGSPGIEPDLVFGADFAPDIQVDVSGQPTVAISINLIANSVNASNKMGFAIGEGLILSRLYPAVLVFVYRLRPKAYLRHHLDGELILDLWNFYKIKLLVKSSP